MKSLRLVVGAAMASLLWAGPAAAVSVDYTGLAFNSSSGPGADNYFFSRLADDYGNFFGGYSQLDAPVIGNVGEAIYSVNGGTAVDNAGGLDGATITFSQGSKSMSFGSHSVRIEGGEVTIDYDSNGCGFFNPCPGVPGVDLPDDLTPLPDLGRAEPDYYINGYLMLSIDGSAPMRFTICDDATCSFEPDENPPSDPYPWIEPFNTLNVGDNAGETDLAMFMFLQSEECTVDNNCPFAEPTQYKFYVCEVKWNGDLKNCDRTWDEDACRALGIAFNTERDGVLTGGAQVNTMIGTGRRGGGPKPKKCKIKEYGGDDDVWMKLALWGAEPSETDTPEPATLSLLGLGLVGLGAAARRRRKAA